ncbi:MAG: hypothetical protein WA324_07160 [Bryobacteraceae bacterium]
MTAGTGGAGAKRAVPKDDPAVVSTKVTVPVGGVKSPTAVAMSDGGRCGLAPSVIEVSGIGAPVTLTSTEADWLGPAAWEEFGAPLKVAESEFAPSVKARVDKIAEPTLLLLTITWTVPKLRFPSKNCTWPPIAGTPLIATAAVRVTTEPKAIEV